MAKIETQQLRSVERGILQGVDHLLAHKQSLYHAVNVEFDSKLGAAMIRKGSDDIAGNVVVVAGVCLGLHSFITATGTVHLLLAINDATPTNSDIYLLASGTWGLTSADLTKDIKCRFLTFLNNVLVTNGTDAARSSADGTTWITTGGVFDIDHMEKLLTVIEWNNRIYGVEKDSSRLIFSSVASQTLEFDTMAVSTFTVGETITDSTTGALALITKVVVSGTAGHLVLSNVRTSAGVHDIGIFGNNNVITGGTSLTTAACVNADYIGVWWDEDSGAGYIDIEPEDGGGNITALAKVPGYVLVFKQRSMKRWNGSSTFPDDLVNIGTPTQESVCLARDSVFFFNERGIYETNGSYPVLRSRPVQDIIEAIPASYLSTVSSYSDRDNVYFSIGDITLDTIAYTNCVLRYTLDTQQWTMYSYKYEPRVWSNYISSNADVVLFGSDGGRVQQINTGTQDDATDIAFVLQTQELQFTDTIQEVTRIVVHTRNGKDAKVYVRVDHKGGFTEIGQIKKDNHEFKVALRGHTFEVRLAGNSTTGFEYKGITIVDINSTITY